MSDHGWLILDKPLGLSSNAALSRLKAFLPRKETVINGKLKKKCLRVGHAGTLDPLATGCLPVAIGEATKLVSYMVDTQKIYQFCVRWGVQTTTDDQEGPPVALDAYRPTRAEILSALPEFEGQLAQIPPVFSALKVEGKRAYAQARAGITMTLAPRLVTIERLRLLDIPNSDTAWFEVVCHKGTYVRALARDLGISLRTRAHVQALRRTQVGVFGEKDMVPLAQLEEIYVNTGSLASVIQPLTSGVAHLERLTLTAQQSCSLRKGQEVLISSAPGAPEGTVLACDPHGTVIALCICTQREGKCYLHPKRVLVYE